MNVLLYSPELFGHPQIYCQVISDILVERGCQVTLLVGLDEEQALRDWPDLAAIAGSPGIRVVACSEFSGATRRELTAEELVAAQRDTGADATLLVDGDAFSPQFRRMADGLAPRLLGRNVAIFSRTSPWFPGEDFYSGARIRWYHSSLRAHLGRAQRALLRRSNTPAHFFERVLLGHRLIDVLLVKDERLGDRWGPQVRWLPDIYRPFRQTETPELRAEYHELVSEYQTFLSTQGGREVLLFVGRGAWYRGYDIFLQLAATDDAVAAVHCGEPYIREPGKEYTFDVDALRRQLRAEGRLFENGRYIRSQRALDFAVSTTRHMVSTHRLTGSSGTMLQALELGKPTLVPDRGVLEYRTRTHGLGALYRYGDLADLRRQWQAFKETEPSSYGSRIEAFIKAFSRERVAECLVQALALDSATTAARC